MPRAHFEHTVRSRHVVHRLTTTTHLAPSHSRLSLGRSHWRGRQRVCHPIHVCSISRDGFMHARSHALFARVATSAVLCRRRRMCALLPPSWIHAPRPYTHPATHITHIAPPLLSHHPPPPPHHQPPPPPCPPRRLRSHPATTTTTTHAPRRHLDPTGHRDCGLGLVRAGWRGVDVRGRHGSPDGH